ncbi:THAP domain-containing protein 3 isoform X2 [Tachyglossus aculeatus]|uniref:THAP domain-containing protein 3 isoform X2 n=1 Tax=Tachyglossus aculeatus TaxID=9261 RepID=UPI0018F3C680|nr:THAP domain-containing protein 3 isoform X2 [Tachyglossus aculeatus]
MPKSCAARHCCNRSSSRTKQLTFHRFPFSRPELLKEWLLNIGRGNFKPKQHTVICSEHFKPECFSAFGNRKNLKQNAVPTVFAFREAVQDFPTAAAESRGSTTGKDVEIAFCEERQLLTGAEAPANEAFLCGATEVAPRLPPLRPAEARDSAPVQTADHSYALSDCESLKRKFLLTLEENERLRRRLKVQRQEVRRLTSCLRACSCLGARKKQRPLPPGRRRRPQARGPPGKRTLRAPERPRTGT